MPQVKLISPITRLEIQKTRVAAYCRVSTNSSDQQNSYAKGYLKDEVHKAQVQEIKNQLQQLKIERKSEFSSDISVMINELERMIKLLDELEEPQDGFDEKLGVQREACRKMPQHARHGLDVHTVLQGQRCEGVA